MNRSIIKPQNLHQQPQLKYHKRSLYSLHLLITLTIPVTTPQGFPPYFQYNNPLEYDILVPPFAYIDSPSDTTSRLTQSLPYTLPPEHPISVPPYDTNDPPINAH